MDYAEPVNEEMLVVRLADCSKVQGWHAILRTLKTLSSTKEKALNSTSNGLAECVIQTVKNGRMKQGGNQESHLYQFVF